MSHHHDDEIVNLSNNPAFEQVLEARLSRRNMLRGGMASSLGLASATSLGALALTACGGGDDAAIAPVTPPVTPPVAPPVADTFLSFPAVAKSTSDAVIVPTGYSSQVINALGDPLFAGIAAYKNDGTDTDFDKRAGDHHDGMEYFGLSATGARDPQGSTRGLLVINHEATSQDGITSVYVHANGGTKTLPRPASEIDKEIPLHGVSVVEVLKTAGSWGTVATSSFNRRVTPQTPVVLSGVAAGSNLMKTKFSLDGRAGRGTLNNCGTGYTPWGTFLTGEENWAGYFTRNATDNTARGGATAKSVVSLNRYGRSQGSASRHGWETAGTDDQYARFIISQTGTSTDGTDDYRNELNTFGYIVEVDPYDPASLIKKRTSLGRFAHESAVFGKTTVGKPLAVYMGDDSRNEYIYKFVSTQNWVAADATAANRLATSDKYLDDGKLYVAKFNADGTGQWIELSMSNPTVAAYTTYAFADNADVAVNSRLAADAVGATKMDRPEWCAVHPTTGEIYYTLTNNSNRRLEPTGTQTPLDAANPRAYTDPFVGDAAGNPARTNGPGNVNGHIIRVKETADSPNATTFTWDVYLFGAEAGASATTVNLSGLTADNDFSSPDGLWFSPTTGIGWIQTDDGSFTDQSNCMMLAAIPGRVGDGAERTLSYTKADSSTLNVKTFVGKPATNTTLKRFMVGPVDCEITGIAETPDGSTIFVNVQHPGERVTTDQTATPASYVSHWPGNTGYGAGGANARPRSATVAISRTDGKRVGI
jgi:uncharacterized protein